MIPPNQTLAALLALGSLFPAPMAFGPPVASGNPATPKGSPVAELSRSAFPAGTSRRNDFLIHGTVFTEKALGFPGVELKIRRKREKKFRWETTTNSRGEFAIRVPPGEEYEIVARARGFMLETRTVNARETGNDQALVFRMARPKEAKS